MGMARPIDAKELEKQIKEVFEDTNPVLMGQMLRWVRKQKTIEAIPVVRCKDCEHWWEEIEMCYHPKCCDGRTAVVEAPKDHFCSYGERKDNA